MDWIIREKKMEDLEGLLELFREGDAYHRAAHPELFKDGGDGFRREFLRSVLTGKNANLFIAENEGTIIGFVYVFVRETLALPVFVQRRFGSIDNLFVQENWRGRGVARSLLQEVERWLKNQGISDVELNVYEFNQQAIALYDRLGFTTISRKMVKSLR